MADYLDRDKVLDLIASCNLEDFNGWDYEDINQEQTEAVREAILLAVERMDTADGQPVKAGDYISRESAIAETLQDGAYGYISTAELERLPAADVVPMETYEQTAWERDAAIEQLEELGYSLGEKARHGHWTLQDDENAKAYGWNICSECGVHVGEPTNYCPNCGAKMDGGSD